MSITCCYVCGQETEWTWTEAFDKFGFDDGDGLVMTEHVANALRAHNYIVTVAAWGCHNIVITSIKRGDVELIPEHANLGYDDPLDYLPPDIIALLDAAFPANGFVEVQR